MKMNKILLSAALLISANAFAMEQSTEVVKNSFFARAKANLNSLLTKGSNVAKNAWAKVPSMNVKAKLTTARTFAAEKCASALTWVKNTAPVIGKAVKTALTSRNAKIAGAALASVATVGTCAYLFRSKLQGLYKQLLSKATAGQVEAKEVAKN